MAWEPAEGAAKSPDGKYMGLIGGQWVPVDGAAKDASGKYMVLRGTGSQEPTGTQSQKPPVKFTPSGEKDQLSWASPEMIAGQPFMRFAKGAAGPFLGMQQLAANAMGMGKDVNAQAKQYEDLTKAGTEAMGGGAQGVETAGSMLSPAFLKAAQAIPAGGRLVTRTAQGAGFGAAGGATAPVTDGGNDFWNSKLEQTGEGTAFGTVLPGVAQGVGKAAKTAYRGLIEPWANPAAIKGREYLNAAGDKIEEIKNLLTRNKLTGGAEEIVAGSKPTAGEAAAPAGRAEFSALQESARKAQPSAYVERADSQNAARVESIKDWAGNPAKRAEAVAAREAAAKPHYDLGESQRLPFDVLAFGELTNRPSTQAAVKRAQRLIQEKTGQQVDIPELVAGQQVTGADAQKVKLAFDDLIKLFPKSGMDSAELAAIKDTRGAYVKWMEENFPALREARRTYKEKSAPINQMDTGEALLEKLTPALREDAKPRSAVFAGAVRDSASTIKKATGEPRYTELSDVLAHRQLQSTHNVVEDLARSDRHQELARAGAGSANALDMASNNLVREGGKPPSFLHRGAMIANYIIARMEGKVDRKLASEMAAEMLNPPGVAKSLAEAQTREARNKALADAIHHWQRPAIAGGASQLSTGD